MGDNALSGLLPGGSASLFLLSEPQFDERWLKSELIAARLIQGIQPSRHSDGTRRAIVEYVERLIQRNFSCQVSTYGSVPLKTYLPDGDIDLSTFSWHPHSSEVWANDLRHLLKREEHNKHAKFCVKEVQVIHAEVQIVKCLVDNVIVDISFNQLGGICTLCFLEEVDRLIGKDHLFKRSIILVKAWCYYESRILGAHHGLISTYALETLVLYIFNIFHTSLRGPFEVLYKFLQFFSQFDWKHYCVGLGGPIRLTALHDMTAEPPQKDRSDYLFSHDFLLKCTQAYGVPHIGAQDFQGRNFISKHMNVVDPLKVDNNLGRSVNRGNFFRICRAFAYGAKQIEKLLHGSPEELSENLDEFFRNTKKFCNGHRPDAPIPRSLDVSIPTMASMAEETEEAGVDSTNQAIRKSNEASQNAVGRPTKTNSSSTNELLEETLDSTMTTDMIQTNSRLKIENDRKVSRAHNENSFSPAVVLSRLEDSATASERMSKIDSHNTNGVPMKANNFFPGASDTTKYDRGNIENARDLSSSENGCNGFCYEANSSAAMSIHHADLAMPNCTADEQPAMQINHSPTSSILKGDFESYLISLEACRRMVDSQLFAPITFPPPFMFPVQHMVEPFASEGPGRPTNSDMNLFSQVFSYNYEQYLNSSFQGLSLQNAYTMPSNRLYQGEVPKSHRGTGTYLPNMRPGYRDTQPMRSGRGGAASSKFPERNGIANQDEAKGIAPRYSHVGARHDGYFSTNTRPEKRYSHERSLQEKGYTLQEEKLSKFPAATSINPGGTTLKFTSQAPEYKPYVARDTKTPSLQTNAFGPSSKNSDSGFLTESLEFGSLGSSFLGRSMKAPNHDGPRKDHDGFRFPNPQDTKNGERIGSAEVTAKKALFNDNQQSPMKRSYELKDEDFPPLSNSGQPNTSTGPTTRKDSAIEWPHVPDSSSRSPPKLQ